MDLHQEIRLHTELMEMGETIRILCPVCRGGSKRAKTLTITVCANLTAKFNCFRAACETTKGHVLLSTAPFSDAHHAELCLPPTSEKRTPKVFEGTTTKLTAYEKEYISEEWGIEAIYPHWYHTNEYGGRIAMSIRSPLYTHRGWVLRDISDTATHKALTYVESGQTPISWYMNPQARSIGTILVEDIPSAVRASKWISRAGALLGTGCGPERAEEISRIAQRPILIALDQDATAIACKMLETHTLMWGSRTKIVLLKQDLKNMSEEDLQDLIVRSV